MHFIFGLFVVGGIIYFAFMRDSEDTTEEAIGKIAKVVVGLFIAIVILIGLALGGFFD